MEETKVIYHIDDEDTPYLIKLPIGPDKVTLGDLKNALNRPNYKYFFKSMDVDFGVVKEELIDENAQLPCINGRVVSWLVAAESSVGGSDTHSQGDGSQTGETKPPSTERLGGIGDSRPPSFHGQGRDMDNGGFDDTCTETESLISNRRDHGGPRHAVPSHRTHRDHRDTGRGLPSHPEHPPQHMNGHRKMDPRLRDLRGFDGGSSVMTSDVDTTSFFDSEDDASSRFSTVTDTTGRSSKIYGRHRQRRRKKQRLPAISRASSFSSITDSTMSLNIITVTLNMDTVNFLGISIVGQSNKGGDGGIYVGSIMKGGAVAQDGRIEPGDMILEVNGVSFENMSNDDAVRALRESVQKPGPITLVVAKCWDPNPKGYFTIPRQEPVRPIDPSAWVAHTNAMQQAGQLPGPGAHGQPRGPGPMSPAMSTVTSTTSSLTSSLAESERFDHLNLTVNTDMLTVVRAMAQPESGLEIRDRMWLKITIPNAFIGSDLVDWLHTHVEGYTDRRDARKYATNLLKSGYIRHTVNKLSFSEQCYYVFGDICGAAPGYDYESQRLYGSSHGSGSNLMPTMHTNMSSLTLEDIDSVSEIDRDTVPPLPPPSWNHHNAYNPYGPTYMPPPPLPPNNYVPPPMLPKPYNYAAPPAGPGLNVADSASYVSVGPGAGNGSIGSGSGESPANNKQKSCACLVSHTYKQIRRLWELPKDKQCPQHVNGQPGGPPYGHPDAQLHGRFDDDINRSTSSSTGSSASGGSRTKREKADISSDRKSPCSGSDTDASSLRQAPPYVPLPPNGGGLPGGSPHYQTVGPPGPPPPPRELENVNPEISGSKGSFRMAMGNPYGDGDGYVGDETLTDMGDL